MGTWLCHVGWERSWASVVGCWQRGRQTLWRTGFADRGVGFFPADLRSCKSSVIIGSEHCLHSFDPAFLARIIISWVYFLFLVHSLYSQPFSVRNNNSGFCFLVGLVKKWKLPFLFWSCFMLLWSIAWKWCQREAQVSLVFLPQLLYLSFVLMIEPIGHMLSTIYFT